MTVTAEKIAGPSILTRDAAVRGMFIGDLMVPAGRRLELHGVIIGNLLIEAGGADVVHGTVNGTLVNRGGHVELFGTANAVQDLAPGSPTRIVAGGRIGS
jgi:hypothetical protein